MGKQYSALLEQHLHFIGQQKIFFVGTAAAEGRVNVSPKGMDTLRVIANNRIAWLNLTGSGNESAAHVQLHPRMTLMFCAFEGPPLILRAYGAARAIHVGEPGWSELFGRFSPLPGARQIFDVAIDLVQTSCGYGVPTFGYQEDRQLLNEWALKKGEDGIRQYWEQKNAVSLDGFPTRMPQPAED